MKKKKKKGPSRGFEQEALLTARGGPAGKGGWTGGNGSESPIKKKGRKVKFSCKKGGTRQQVVPSKKGKKRLIKGRDTHGRGDKISGGYAEDVGEALNFHEELKGKKKGIEEDTGPGV